MDARWLLPVTKLWHPLDVEVNGHTCVAQKFLISSDVVSVSGAISFDFIRSSPAMLLALATLTALSTLLVLAMLLVLARAFRAMAVPSPTLHRYRHLLVSEWTYLYPWKLADSNLRRDEF